MLYYDRQIIYIDYMEAGSKMKNAGFLKKEETEDSITWNMQIKGLYETDTGFFDLRDETGALIDKILLKRGSGSYKKQFPAGELSRGGRDIRQICGITIRLSPGREVTGRWRGREECLKAADIPQINEVSTQRESVLEQREILPARDEMKMQEPWSYEKILPRAEEPENSGADTGIMDNSLTTDNSPDSENVEKKPFFNSAEGDSVRENGSLSAEKLCRRCMHKRFTPQEKKESSDDLMQEEFFEDKWEQLCHMYPTVHPFADEREYLSITPKDFVVLGSEYQKMVRNSFLLHGYYNYRHIILGKYNAEGEQKYYLGVPGVYYDREKMAAEMFGFEAFEGSQTPAQPGSFGYYMKSVRI